MDFEEHDEIDGGIGSWPAFVDLLAATSLLFVALLAVVLVWVGSGQGGKIETQRQTIIRALKDSTIGFGSAYEIDTTDVTLVKLVLYEEATFPRNQYAWDSLRSEGRDALEKVALTLEGDDSLRDAYREIRILGHSDQDPYSDPNASFSNWELSAARAAVVARFLATRTKLDPCRLSASGYGPYHPAIRPMNGELLNPDDKEKNRRVELVFVPTAWKSGSDPELDVTGCYSEGDGTARASKASR